MSTLIWASVLIVAGAAAWALRDRLRRRAVPKILEPGNRLPDFDAVDDRGKPVGSADLRGHPAVLLFVRGTWCPFCSSQVRELTRYYREITASGARLVLMTPKPLETTRRVAEFFDVDFEFWLDKNLDVARRLGLLVEGVVPGEYRAEFGEDSLWPTSLVVDADGIIRYTSLSRFLLDRPDPRKLLRIVSAL